MTLDDPELFKYPIAYIIEVGWWTLTDREAAALRAYLQKGGFLIVDDFKTEGWRGMPGGGWEPFDDNMQRVLPGARFFDMDADASDLPFVLRDQRRSTTSRRPTTAATRSSAASTRTTIRTSG